MDKQYIEVYELPEGADKPRSGPIAQLDVPPDGQLPQMGDRIFIHTNSSDGPFVVLRRVLVWTAFADSETAAWSKMWLHVRSEKGSDG